MQRSVNVSNKSYLSEGNRLFLNKKYTEAISYYQKAIDISPDLYIYYENIGWCYDLLGDTSLAEIFYQKSLMLNNRSVRAITFLEKKIKAAACSDGASANHFFSEARLAANRVDKISARKKYFDSHLHLRANDFVLFRIIGNDLYPRHKIGQSRENIEFILKNEPALPMCKKVWIVNRIFDKDELNKIISLLKSYHQDFHVIPFVEEEYKVIDFDYACLPSVDYLKSKEFEKIGTAAKQRLLIAMHRLKNNYVMNNNGARNYALKLGKTMAKWVLPWDGNCYVNRVSWNAIVTSVTAEPYLANFVVPMARVTSNELLLDDNFVPEASEEPQIIFRQDTREQFNEHYYYGRRSKIELFWRLAIPGAWDTFVKDPWDQPRLPTSKEANQFGMAGWTARLFSGMAEQEAPNVKGASSRAVARQVAIIAAISLIDKTLNVTTALTDELEQCKKSMLSSVSSYDVQSQPLICQKSSDKMSVVFSSRYPMGSVTGS